MADFPKMKAGDRVSAAHLNALSEIAKRYQAEVPDSGYGAVAPLRTMIITAVFTEPSDQFDEDDESSYSSSSSFSSSRDSSVSSSSMSSSSGPRTSWRNDRSYQALPLFYDHGGRTWVIDTTHDPYDLDASAFHGEFVVGDTCLAFWDAARTAYIAQPTVSAPGSSPGLMQIRFCIHDPYTPGGDPCTVLADILSRPYGVSQVPEEDLNGYNAQTVYVRDAIGCFLQGPSEDLVGLGGYACYMESVENSDVSPGTPSANIMPPGAGTCPGAVTPRWEIIQMCCRQDRCDLT